ncbi:MAG: flagellar protein FlaG [Treponema sp.]|nr:flagellar protein FlaG [Treponema sp.]
MSMQITALSAGSGIAPVAQELPQERAALKARAEANQKAAVALDNFEANLPGKKDGQVRSEEIRAATEELEQVSLAFNRKLKFFVDHDSQQILVKVIDSQTDKVIKVLPPEELQRLHNRIKETIGFLFDERV